MHEYLTEGTYTVTLVATNLVGDNTEIKTDYVTVAFPVTPTVVGDTNCVDQTATLVAAGEGTLNGIQKLQEVFRFSKETP